MVKLTYGIPSTARDVPFFAPFKPTTDPRRRAAVYAQTQTRRDPDPVTVRVLSVSDHGFSMLLEEQESKRRAALDHRPETIGYVAVAPPSADVVIADVTPRASTLTTVTVCNFGLGPTTLAGSLALFGQLGATIGAKAIPTLASGACTAVDVTHSSYTTTLPRYALVANVPEDAIAANNTRYQQSQTCRWQTDGRTDPTRDSIGLPSLSMSALSSVDMDPATAGQQTWPVQGDPTVFRAPNGTYTMLLGSCQFTDECVVTKTTSAQGTTWSTPTVALRKSSSSTAWDRGRVESPELVVSGGRWYMFYTGNSFATAPTDTDGQILSTTLDYSIGLAISDNAGATWTRQPAPVLAYQRGLRESLGLFTPSIVFDTSLGLWVMYYGAADDFLRSTIHRATAPALAGPWTRSAGGPVMRADVEQLSGADLGPAEPAVRYLGSAGYEMYYSYYGLVCPTGGGCEANPANYRMTVTGVWYARSPDGITWYKGNREIAGQVGDPLPPPGLLLEPDSLVNEVGAVSLLSDPTTNELRAWMPATSSNYYTVGGMTSDDPAFYYRRTQVVMRRVCP